MAAGLAPGKSYVRGYEIETIGTTIVNIPKARNFDTQNNFQTRFDVGNYVHVKNVYNTPDVNEDSGGTTDAYKALNLFSIPSSARGTVVTNSGSKVYEIGRAKSRGFHYLAGSPTSYVMSSSSLTGAIYRNYLFDIEMFTHLNITTNVSFTNGEKITGGTSNAVGYVQNISTTEATAASSITVASPGVVTATGHNLREGQQITFSAISAQNNSTVITTSNVFTVRNPGTNDFELYEADGTTATNITSYSSSGNVLHGVVVCSSVNGTFVAGETITGGTSSNTSIIQSDAVGLKGVRSYDFSAVKHLGQPGTSGAGYTSDVARSATYGESLQISGTISVANSGTSVSGFGTLFNTELKVGYEITFATDGGTSLTRIIEAIENDTTLTISVAVGGSDVSTKTVATRNRGKLQDQQKNISIFNLPNKAVKTLKTTDNNGITDTNFKVRRQFVQQLSSGSGQISAGTNETFASLAEGDYSISITAINAASSGSNGDNLSITGNNGDGNPIFTLSGSPTGKTLDLDFGTAYADAEIRILATVNRQVAGSKTKTLNEDQTLAVSSQSTIESGTIGLGKADVYVLNKVYMSPDFSTAATTSHTDITSRFELDTGQRDNFYDIGRIKLKDGELTPTGRLLVDFDYFSHGSGDYFDVDSYSGVVNYKDIPSYSSDTTGRNYDLRDCLDFRPRVAA